MRLRLSYQGKALNVPTALKAYGAKNNKKNLIVKKKEKINGRFFLKTIPPQWITFALSTKSNMSNKVP